MDRLIQQLARLPGIGHRSAERIAFYLLRHGPQEARALAEAILDLTRRVRQCSICFSVAEQDPCQICADARRDQTTILVVEEPKDVVALEQSAMYQGVYHVLMGRLAPLENVGPDDLTTDALLQRIGTGTVAEVIIGTSPTLEGDGTALHLAEQLRRRGVKVTRLARGLPTGTALDIVSKAVLADAIHGRQQVDS